MNVNWEGLLPIEGLVIVVEDDPTLRGLMADILADIATNVIEFGTADDALTYLLEHRGECSLAIVDHGLPGQIQGAEFIELAKTRWPAIATILTSGYLIEPATVPLGTIYLHKPWSMDDFVNSVSALLQPGHGSTCTTAES
ncbi:response regulator [Pseudomonas bananamidigenes]|uniref:response regulator n=1 Tax=Pseudomonas bananamidigenes TaxID=2843610 RepID=UPI0008038358|nr:response regulator [Pseudomonas bananamidigenes]